MWSSKSCHHIQKVKIILFPINYLFIMICWWTYRIVPSSYCSFWICQLPVGTAKKCWGIYSHSGGRFELPNIELSGVTRLHEKNWSRKYYDINEETDDPNCMKHFFIFPSWFYFLNLWLLIIFSTKKLLSMCPFAFGPRIDSERLSPFLPDSPQSLVQRKQFNQVPVIFGLNEDEGGLFAASKSSIWK